MIGPTAWRPSCGGLDLFVILASPRTRRLVELAGSGDDHRRLPACRRLLRQDLTRFLRDIGYQADRDLPHRDRRAGAAGPTRTVAPSRLGGSCSWRGPC